METINFSMPNELYNEMYFLFLNIKNISFDDLSSTLDNFLKENLSDGISEEYIFFTLRNAFETGEVMGEEITNKTTLRLCNEWLKKQETPKLSTLIESGINIKNAESPKTVKPELYKYDAAMIMRVYAFCDKSIFDCGLTTFLTCIETADFNEINLKDGHKGQFYTMIYKLSGKLEDSWYSEATNNLGISKSLCSGKVVKTEWLYGLEKEISGKEYKARQ